MVASVKNVRQRVELPSSALATVPEGVLTMVFSYATPSELACTYMLCARRFRNISIRPGLWRALATRYQILPASPAGDKAAPKSRPEILDAMWKTISISKTLWNWRPPKNCFIHLLHLHVNWIAILQNINHPELCMRWREITSGLPELPPFDHETLKQAAPGLSADLIGRRGLLIDNALDVCCNITRGLLRTDSPAFLRLYREFQHLSHFDENYRSTDSNKSTCGDLLSEPPEPVEISSCPQPDRQEELRTTRRERFKEEIVSTLSSSREALRDTVNARLVVMPIKPSAWLARSVAIRTGIAHPNLVTAFEMQRCLESHSISIPQDFFTTVVRHFAETRSFSLVLTVERGLKAGVVPNGDFYTQLLEASKKKNKKDNLWNLSMCAKWIFGAIEKHYKDQIEPYRAERLEASLKLDALFATMQP